MLKLRVALCLALFVSTLTLAVGLATEARLTIIIYRTMVSFLLFGALGLVFGSLAERFLHECLQRLMKGQPSKAVSDSEPAQEQDGQAAFSPLNPDNFEHIEQNKE